MVATHYIDSNVYHDTMMGRSLICILHLINKTPLDWFSKKEATAETAAYRSEFMAGRTYAEQIVYIRINFRYLGVTLRKICYMFGENASVVNSASILHTIFYKMHIYLSFNRVKEVLLQVQCHAYSYQVKTTQPIFYQTIWDMN